MRPKSRNEFTIAIICALPLEADAVDGLFDETYDRLSQYYRKQPGDANAYINGRIGKHNVVLCYLPGIGKGSAASVASSLQVSYKRIELVLVVGICGGAPSSPSGQDIFLGDIIISDSVIEYDFGRQYPEESKPRHSMIPFRRNLHFVGRQDEIYRLEEAISTAQGPQKIAITGLGGVGKSQIALELAYRMQDRDPVCSIFWIPCTSYQAVEQACMAIAQMIGIEDANPAEVKERIKAYFSRKDWKWLLIFDNADDMDMWMEDSSTGPPLKDLLPDSNQGHIVFTTRNRKLAVKLASSNVIHVRELDDKTGVEFLEKSLIEKSLLNDSYAVVALLEQLTFLPLAVAQAAAYMNENSIGISDYLLLLQEQEADVVELLSEDFGDDGRYKILRTQ